MPSESISPFSRRSFLQLSAAAAAFQMVTEPMLAAAARPSAFSKDAVMIDSNENPLGPGQSARDAISAIIPMGGRYLDNLTEDLVHTFAQLEGLNPDWVHVFPGSSPALHFGVDYLYFAAKKLCDAPIPVTKLDVRGRGARKPAW